MVVYPDSVGYSTVGAGDVAEIVRTHFQEGYAVERLANKGPEGVRAETQSHRNKILAAMGAKAAAAGRGYDTVMIQPPPNTSSPS